MPRKNSKSAPSTRLVLWSAGLEMPKDADFQRLQRWWEATSERPAFKATLVCPVAQVEGPMHVTSCHVNVHQEYGSNELLLWTATWAVFPAQLLVHWGQDRLISSYGQYSRSLARIQSQIMLKINDEIVWCQRPRRQRAFVGTVWDSCVAVRLNWSKLAATERRQRRFWVWYTLFKSWHLSGLICFPDQKKEGFGCLFA